MSLLTLTCGISLSWSSPIIVKLKDKNNTDDNPLGHIISDEEDSWIASLLSLGAVLGPFPAGYLTQNFGRKFALQAAAAAHFMCYVILAFSKTVTFYYIARFLGGVALGASFTIVPVFLAEIAEPKNRGLIVTCALAFMPSVGLLICYAVGPIVSIFVFNLIPAIISALFILIVFFVVPESPYYLIGIGNNEEASDSLAKFRKFPQALIDKEIEEIQEEIRQSSAGNFLDLFRDKTCMKAFIISLALTSFQSLSGFNVALSYIQPIFNAATSSISPDASAIVVGLVQIVICGVVPFLVDSWGRRILLIISGIIMSISIVSLGVYFYIKDETRSSTESIFWLPVVSLISYITGYACGLGPLPLTLMGEVLPLNIKSSASSVTVGFCWILSFVVTRSFVPLQQKIGLAGTFWIFSGFCLLSSLFTAFYVPETKGKSLQEIHKQLH